MRNILLIYLLFISALLSSFVHAGISEILQQFRESTTKEQASKTLKGLEGFDSYDFSYNSKLQNSSDCEEVFKIMLDFGLSYDRESQITLIHWCRDLANNNPIPNWANFVAQNSSEIFSNPQEDILVNGLASNIDSLLQRHGRQFLLDLPVKGFNIVAQAKLIAAALSSPSFAKINEKMQFLQQYILSIDGAINKIFFSQLVAKFFVDANKPGWNDFFASLLNVIPKIREEIAKETWEGMSKLNPTNFKAMLYTTNEENEMPRAVLYTLEIMKGNLKVESFSKIFPIIFDPYFISKLPKNLMDSYFEYLIDNIDHPLIVKVLKDVEENDAKVILYALTNYAKNNPMIDQNKVRLGISLLVPKIYQTNITEFTRMLFPSVPKKETLKKEEAIILPQAQPRLLIYSLTGLQSKFSKQYINKISNVIEGGSLSLDDNTPIGYNIYLPDTDEVQAVYVEIYGGGAEKYEPGKLEQIDKYLLSQGIAVVHLNLIDLLELKTNQRMMPEKLQERLLQSILKFFNTVNYSPQTLDKSVAAIAKRPMFLYGQSFGGRTVARYATWEPGKNTFAGFISLDGSLDSAVLEKMRTPISIDPQEKIHSVELYEARKWLDPSNYLQYLHGPILILHNNDDNRVNVMVSLSFFKKAQLAGKDSLVHLVIFEHGNPISGDLQFKGHLMPMEPRALLKVGRTIIKFMKQTSPLVPAKSELAAHNFEIFASRYAEEASMMEKFISAAYRYFISTEAQNKSAFIDIQKWNEKYVPLFYAFAYLDYIKNHQEIRDKEMKGLERNLTDDNIVKGLKTHATLFAQYLNEKKIANYEPEILGEVIANNAEIGAQYRQWIKDSKKMSYVGGDYILDTLIEGNPELVNDSKDMLKAYEPMIKEAKQKLESAIQRRMSLSDEAKKQKASR